MRRFLLVPCCLAVLLPFLQQPQSQPTFRSRVDVVVVDVHAVDGSGRPVSDLRPDEFTISVDGKPRSIVGAEYVSYPTAATPAGLLRPRLFFTSNESNAAFPPGRWILLVVDEENIRTGYARSAAEAIAGFLDRVQDNDRVGLVTLATAGAIHIDPTTDRTGVKEALQRIVGHMVPVDTGSPYHLGLAEAFAFRQDRSRWGAAVGRECGNARPGCAEELAGLAQTMMADARQRMVGATRGILGLLDSVARVPGAKTIVFMSQELPVSTYVGEQANFNAEVKPLAGAAARAQATLYVLHLDRPQIDVEQRTGPGDPFEEADVRSFGLETLSSVTGGRRLMVAGKVEGAMNRVALEISGYYLLGFRAEAPDRDGQPHAIKVTVQRKGVDLRARSMFAFSGEPVKGAASGAAEIVNHLFRVPDVATQLPLAVTTYVMPEPGTDAGKIRVLVTADLDTSDARPTPTTVGYVILDANGQNVGGIVEQVVLKPAPAGPDRRLRYLAAAVVPPGRYTLRFAAVDAALRAGSVEHPFEATLTKAGPLALGELVVFDRYPDDAGKPRPSVRSAVSGSVDCYLDAHAVAAPPPDLHVALEIADGPSGPARARGTMAAQTAATQGRVLLGGSVALGEVVAGDYTLRAVVSAGGIELGRVIRPIRVVSDPAQIARVTPAHPGLVAQPAENLQKAAERLPDAVAAPTSGAGAAPATSYSAPAKSVEELMERVGRYCRAYAAQMSLIVSVENYAQWMQTEDAPRPVQRQLVSEFALLRTKDDWDGFRDVYEVDGKPVTDRHDRLTKLFTESPASALEQSRKIAAESARYNMGTMQRNFNVPTTALYFFKAENQPRFKYRKDNEDQVDGLAVWKVRYEETRKPTIIRTSQGKDMPVHGTLWVDPLSGAVLKTHMEITSEMMLSPDPSNPLQNRALMTALGPRSAGMEDRRVNTSASITVTYRRDSTLGLIVPAEMRETYEGPYRSEFTGKETQSKINCRATYSDFKRFETGARVIPK